MEVAIVTFVAKCAAATIRPIGRYIVCPVARCLCPLKNLWKYESNLGKLKAEVKELETKRGSVRGLTEAGVERLPEVNVWLEEASNVINEVSKLITKDNPEQQETGCCKGCTYSNLKGCCKRCTYSNFDEWRKHRNTVACKLKNVTRLLEKATRSMSLWTSKSNLENLKKGARDLESQRDTVKKLIKEGEEPLPRVKTWQRSVESIIMDVPGIINPQQQNMQCCQGHICSDLNICSQCSENVVQKLTNVAELLRQATEFGDIVSTMSDETKYKINLENLKKQVEKLQAKEEGLECLIKVGEKPLPDVMLWQNKTSNIIKEVSGLTSQNNPHQQNILAQMLDDVAELLQEFDSFKKFSFRPIPQEPWIQSSKGYEAFESRTSVLKEIIKALSEPDVGIVGIYGMGGIGKTTLAKQVARQVIQLFEKIVFVEVSPTADIKKVQGVIGSKLGLQFLEEDGSCERASQLLQQLKSEQKTLLILDNIWQRLDFETLGIPDENDRKGLKLLMTARKEDVLTEGKIFSIGVLEWPDAWSLFKSKAGTCVDRHDLREVAVDVAKECGGVPLGIVGMATTLSTKGTAEWNTVLRKLKSPFPGDFVGEEAKVYQITELSYEYLETEELKETFLLCSRMGSTHDASVEDLLRYGIGLGLFNRFNTMQGEWDNVCSLVNRLKASSLLVHAPKVEHFCDNQLFNVERFAMHDVVCYVGRLIAKRDKNVDIVIDDVIPCSWKSEENKLTNCISITLHDVKELSEDLQLVCPQLEFLYVKPKISTAKRHSRISNKFFAWMPKLQVLHLIQMDLQPLSPSLRNLVNLRTFCLENCVLKDIAGIKDLRNLEILSFHHCEGLKLPKELPQLTKLRLLGLNSFELSSIPSEFILSFKNLEALYMSYTTIEWELEKCNNRSKNVIHNALEHLSNLTSLEIRVEDDTMLRVLLSPKLERYKITIGNPKSATPVMRLYSWDIPCKTSRFLAVKLTTNENGIISRLKAIRQLVLDEVPGIANNFCGLDRMGFPELEDLKVQKNSHILHIVDTVSHSGAFPILKSLILWKLFNLKSICNGPLGRELFLQLRIIRVGKCNELINVFSFVSDRVFEELEEIEVLECENIEGIFAISEQVHEIKFSKLRILRLSSLPQLESLCCNVKTTTPILPMTSHTKPGDVILEEQDVCKPLFNEKVVVTNLETLKINNVNVKMIWDNQLPMMYSIQNLTCLIISNLANLRSLGSGECIEFPSLRKMKIESCPRLEELFFDDKVRVPSLEEIKILKMDGLKMIWQGQLGENFLPKLKSLQVKGCQMLLTLFRSSMCQSFLSLETLYVSKCGSLEVIFDLDGLNFEERHCTASTQSGESCISNLQVLFSFANLHKLKVSKCQRLKNLFYVKEEVVVKEASHTSRFVFPKLIDLELHKLPKLRTFYPGRYIMEWPILKWFEMVECGIDDTNESNKQRQKLRKRELLEWRLQLPWKQGNQVVFQFQVGKIWSNLLQTISSWVENLTMLVVHGCDHLEELFSYSMTVTEKLKEKTMENTILFPELKFLKMQQLANLKGLCSGYHIKFPKLREFKISNCPEFTTFIFSDKIEVPILEVIYISSLDKLETVWGNLLVEDSIPKLKSFPVECQVLLVSFENLQKLKVSKCRSLKNIFSVSTITEERVTAREAHATVKFVFPKLTFLRLYKLPQLRTFYPDRYTVEWPILRTLELWDCRIPDTDDEDQMQHPLFLVEKVVPCLVRWTLARRELMMMWQGLDAERLFQNFKILCVSDESRADYWYYRDRPVLRYMGNVEYMWKQNFILDLILPNFEDIEVVGCDSFIILMPPSAAFQCLTSLEVRDCNSLEHIGTFSMAKNLVKLVHLRIEGCKQIVEVVRNHGDGTGDKILFSNLKSLLLMELPSLTSFCSWNFNLEFPSLEELHVNKCLNMKIFSQGDLTMPKLQKVKIGPFELRSDVDINTAIQEHHERYRNLSRAPKFICDHSTDESELPTDESE